MGRENRRPLLGNRNALLVAALLAALVGFGVVALVMSRRSSGDAPTTTTTTPASRSAATTPNTTTNPATPADRRTPADGDSVMSQIFGIDEPASATAQPATPENWTVTILRVAVRLLLAAILAAVLAFRPRKFTASLRRNPYVAQTQILLAVVASSLMMIVGDSAARAFGIFAAASLVRFRTNIRDPKETTVLLVSLAIGLATGVGRWELALVLALFVLPLLWLLEYGEHGQVFRAMELIVRTRDTDGTQENLKRIFDRHGLATEVRQLDPPDEEEPVGCISYHINMNLHVSTDRINDEILASDPQNIEGIEWKQQKKDAYM